VLNAVIIENEELKKKYLDFITENKKKKLG